MSQVRLKWVRATAGMRIGPGNSEKTGLSVEVKVRKNLLFNIQSVLWMNLYFYGKPQLDSISKFLTLLSYW